MAEFKVRAATPEGRVVTRQVTAASAQHVALQLKKEGLYLLEAKSRGFRLPFTGPGRLKGWEFLTFNQGLAALLKAGLPVTECFEILLQRTGSPVLSEAIEDTMDGVRQGKSISEAMGAHPAVFPPLYIATISAGERTGDLVPAIQGHIEYLKRTEAIRKKVKSAATYPVVLVGLSLVVAGVMVLFVVPRFSRIYLGAGMELPLPTKVLLSVSGFVTGNFWVLLAALAVLVYALRLFMSTGGGRAIVDAFKLSLPRLGEIYLGYAMGMFTRTLGMILASGIPIIEALAMARGVLDNSVLEAKMDRVLKGTREGETVSNAIGEAGLMPDVTLSMFAVGEKSASLPAVLNDIADFHDEDVDHKVKILTGLIEPLLMVVMGLFIAAMVVALYLPIFMIGETV